MSKRDDLSSRFTDDAEVDHAVKKAVRRALADHKRKGSAIAVWGEGQVRIVTAEEIQVTDDHA